MTTKIRKGKPISRGTDYLGILGAKLRDLQGFATLAHELIQNADDAPGAVQMSFDVSADALIVDNDGIFSDCGQVHESDCPWKSDPSIRHYCDFHRFRRVASGDKRDQAGTIGAFGIGFISVLQITDEPQVISGGRHWILSEASPESERITECEGCEDCQAGKVSGTRFILGWVRDSNSLLRRMLRAPAQSDEAPGKLLEELRRSLPAAMLFLKKLRKMRVTRDGKPVLSLERLVDKDSLIINDGKQDRIWHLFRGDFREDADELRREHVNRIEDKRTAELTLAVPEHQLDSGLLCAYLPTQQQTGLPFHLNADFFPSSDRKRIILESDFQSDWNRAAIRAAATTLKVNLDRLPRLLKHKHLWHLLKTVQQVAIEAEAGHKEETLGLFWESILPQLRRSQVFFTTRSEWKTAADVLFLSEEESDAVPVLEGLGLSLLHADLRQYFNLFRSKDVGVQLADIVHVAEALRDAGIDERTELSALPSYLQSEKARRQLRRELVLLLARSRKPEEQSNAERMLARCAVVPGCDGAMWPCQEVYRADKETIALFSKIAPHVPFLADLEKEAEPLKSLCPEFTPGAAVECLTQILIGGEPESQPENLAPAPVLKWFESRREALLRTPAVTLGLAALPIYPCGEGLQPLALLSLPGNFTDPIGLAGIVDLKQLGGRSEFLRDLGAKELTLSRYASDHVPNAFRRPETTTEQKRRVMRLLADRLGEIRDDEEVQDALANVAVIECSDGLFRRPEKVYFNNDAVQVVLGNEVPLAVIPTEHSHAIWELYRWLGVAEDPRFENIVERIKVISASPPTQPSVDAITKIFRHLDKRMGQEEKSDPALMRLRSHAWLPARDDRHRWHRPGDLYATFQDYLFESKGKFLDLSREVQTSCAELLDFLLVKTKPTTRQVVEHLLHCSDTNTVVNKEVYRFLNDNAQDDAIGALSDRRCLLLPDNTFVKPSQVFWGDHPFGRFRYRLGLDLRKYGELFARLGVREIPDYRDAMAVIDEISEAFGNGNHPLDEPALGVLIICWQRLERALIEELFEADDLARFKEKKVIPDVRHVLNPPEWMFFEDRAGLAAKFKGFLQNNVIPRPQGAWRAMATAGVRVLSGAVKLHLVECTDPKDDDFVLDRLHERRQQLARVLESQDSAVGSADWSLLNRIRCQTVTELKIRYSLSAFNRELHSDPENLPAKYEAEQKILYFVHRSKSIPWPSIAREISLAFSPDADPGRLAAGIKEVLAAESFEQATSMLDELGFAPLEINAVIAAGEDKVVEDLGGNETSPEQTQLPDSITLGSAFQSGWHETPEAKPETKDADQKQSVLTAASAPTAGQAPLSTQDAIASILGPGAATPSSLPLDLERQLQDRPENRDGSRGGKSSGERHGPQSSSRNREDGRQSSNRSRDDGQQRQGKLRTYVSREPVDDEVEVDADGAAKRSAVDKAGIALVLKYEENRNRDPEEMPPNHPGYDIESRNSAGEIERYIEVKSLSGDWGTQGAALSETQFRKATDLGDRYWLYVVARAEQNSSRIYRIQNPARLVNQFIYDDGWQTLSEVDGAVKQELQVAREPLQ